MQSPNHKKTGPMANLKSDQPGSEEKVMVKSSPLAPHSPHGVGHGRTTSKTPVSEEKTSSPETRVVRTQPETHRLQQIRAVPNNDHPTSLLASFSGMAAGRPQPGMEWNTARNTSSAFLAPRVSFPTSLSDEHDINARLLRLQQAKTLVRELEARQALREAQQKQQQLLEEEVRLLQLRRQEMETPQQRMPPSSYLPPTFQSLQTPWSSQLSPLHTLPQLGQYQHQVQQRNLSLPGISALYVPPPLNRAPRQASLPYTHGVFAASDLLSISQQSAKRSRQEEAGSFPGTDSERPAKKLASVHDDTKMGDSIQAQQWDDMYRELCIYRERFGTCLVPQHTAGNLRLARWVKRQRYQYKLMKEAKVSNMTTERVRKLESIGFVWDSHTTSWQERFEELVAYKKQKGNCNVPITYQANRKLAAWVKCQRRQYKLLVDGESSNITQERVRALESIGFEWRIRKQDNADVPFAAVQEI